MKRMKSGLISGLIGLAALVAMSASPAQAAFVVGGENGWQMSFDGMINIFAVYTFDGNRRASTAGVLPGAVDQSFRTRTGLLPSIFAFNVKSPTINGVDYGARIGLYPQVNNTATRTGFGPDDLGFDGEGGARLDIREVFFTADGCFGQILAGRALNLYQGKNILTDMTLMGVGIPGDLTGAGTTLGRIGFGYTYAAFGPQFRYTTPDMKGFKVAFEIADPSRIGTAASGAFRLNQPRFETELSYATNLPGGKMQAWAAGLYQKAKFKADNHNVASIGGSGGAGVTFGPVDVLVSGFGGKGIGLTLTQDDGNALDAAGKEVLSYGGLAQALYTIGKVKIGGQYGINYRERGNDTSAAQKSQQAATGAVFYSVNKYLQVVGEYTWARFSYYNHAAFDRNSISLGTVFVW